jgi:hypothetical protein
MIAAGMGFALTALIVQLFGDVKNEENPTITYGSIAICIFANYAYWLLQNYHVGIKAIMVAYFNEPESLQSQFPEMYDTMDKFMKG